MTTALAIGAILIGIGNAIQIRTIKRSPKIATEEKPMTIGEWLGSADEKRNPWNQ